MSAIQSFPVGSTVAVLTVGGTTGSSRPGRGQVGDEGVELRPLDMPFENQVPARIVFLKEWDPCLEHKIEAASRLDQRNLAIQCEMEVPIGCMPGSPEDPERLKGMSLQAELGDETIKLRLIHHDRLSSELEGSDPVQDHVAEGKLRHGAARKREASD